MLKFNCVLLMVILCGGLHLSSGEKLKCLFLNQNFFVVGTLYTCKVTSLDNSFDNNTIDGFTGTHMATKNDKDVKGIYIRGANLKYIPHGLGSLSNLLGLAIHNSQLVEINNEDFLGMENLFYLSLMSNKLTSVPLGTFSTLTKLKQIYLHSNQIKYIGSGVFDQLNNLNYVGLSENICINKYYDGPTLITKMKEDLKVNCVERLSTSTTTTTTTQNPKEEELDNLKNELFKTQKLQQENEIEISKLRGELQNAQLENDKATKENLRHSETTNSSTRLHSVLQPQYFLIIFFVFKFNSPTVNL